jgi:hypothetical protein
MMMTTTPAAPARITKVKSRSPGGGGLVVDPSSVVVVVSVEVEVVDVVVVSVVVVEDGSDTVIESLSCPAILQNAVTVRTSPSTAGTSNVSTILELEG